MTDKLDSIPSITILGAGGLRKSISSSYQQGLHGLAEFSSILKHLNDGTIFGAFIDYQPDEQHLNEAAVKSSFYNSKIRLDLMREKVLKYKDFKESVFHKYTNVSSKKKISACAFAFNPVENTLKIGVKGNVAAFITADDTNIIRNNFEELRDVKDFLVIFLDDFSSLKGKSMPVSHIYLLDEARILIRLGGKNEGR